MQEILPDFILADLYPSSLVILDESPTPSIIPKLKNEKFYLGSNGKKITILVNEANAVFLTDHHLDFLTKILGACKLNLGDVAVVNIEQHPMLFTEIKKSLTPTVCLLFNVIAENIQLPFTIPHYQVQQYDNCTFLMAPDLSTYAADNDNAKIEKTKLWVSLKKIFNI